ncbi:TPR-like protein [Cubamyces sp. BRFM 1775]|nr:TPR-like protein [Cubamyces sp. BRFM 1775]
MSDIAQKASPSDILAEPSSAEIPDSVTDDRSEEHIKRCLKDAEELKQEGNEHFRSKQWDEALAKYKAALGRLPKRIDPPPITNKGKGRAADNIDEDAEEDVPEEAPPTEEVHDEAVAESTKECAKARAILNANIAACFVKLDDNKEVVAACSEALKDDPRYVKALQRRAAANEQIGSWSSLTSAQEDYKQLVELLPSRSSVLVAIRRSLAALPSRIEAAQKRETTEMLDKLKGLGNSILGNFGLSTDNFQFVPNGQGGYSVNFTR